MESDGTFLPITPRQAMDGIVVMLAYVCGIWDCCYNVMLYLPKRDQNKAEAYQLNNHHNSNAVQVLFDKFILSFDLKWIHS